MLYVIYHYDTCDANGNYMFNGTLFIVYMHWIYLRFVGEDLRLKSCSANFE